MKPARRFLEKTRRWDARRGFRFHPERMSVQRMRPNRARSTFLLSFLALCVAVIPRSAAQTATITYTQDFPGSEPAHYSIAVSQEGHARYESSGKLSDDSDAVETYRHEFELSPKNCGRIFELAKQAKYFAGHVDSANNKLAFTGPKQLAYPDG